MMAGKRKLEENRFTASCLGRRFCFDRQSAMDQLRISGQAAALAAELVGLGLHARQAEALAHNSVLLAQTLTGEDVVGSAREVLERFSLAQIAALARCYWQQDDLPFDEGWDEGGVNEGYGIEEAAG